MKNFAGFKHLSTPRHGAVGALLLLASFTPSLGHAVGFQLDRVPDAGHKDLQVGIWYPSPAEEPDAANTEFGHALSIDAPLSPGAKPLVIISHGFGGWYGGHANTARHLAESGFIVAAPTHTGNTFSDMSSPIEQWTLDRPRHVSRVIDHLLSDTDFASHINTDAIGIYGFSAGGFTALNVIGGWPDLTHADEACQTDPTEFICKEGMIDAMLDAGMADLPTEAWGADPRVKAAAISAPGFAFSYTEASLTDVSAAVQLWSGNLDESVPTESNAAYLAEILPVEAETHWIEKANHFAFMIMQCRPEFEEADPEEYLAICGDAEGFDRWEFQDRLNAEMTRFFEQNLLP